MQVKRIRSILNKKGIEVINYGIDGRGKRDYFTKMSFNHEEETYVIWYDRLKLKGHEYSIGCGRDKNSITIMNSNMSYINLKFYLEHIL